MKPPITRRFPYNLRSELTSVTSSQKVESPIHGYMVMVSLLISCVCSQFTFEIWDFNHGAAPLRWFPCMWIAIVPPCGHLIDIDRYHIVFCCIVIDWRQFIWIQFAISMCMCTICNVCMYLPWSTSDGHWIKSCARLTHPAVLQWTRNNSSQFKLVKY